MAERCNTCQAARGSVVTAERVISLDMRALPVWGTGKDLKEERRKLLNCFMKHVCALRNTGGGLLLVHFIEKVHQSLDLNAFSEMVDVRLNSMIEDDTLFVDNYEREWLEEFDDVLLLKVKSSWTCSTTDFKTKIPLDSSLLDPTARCIPKLYTRSANNKKREPLGSEIDWSQEFVPLFESRNVQLKRFGADLAVSIQETADKIWNSLKLKENITAMTKTAGGGSYFCGIEEVGPQNFRIKRSKVLGMKLISDERNELKNTLLEKVREEMLWTTSENEVIPAPTDIVDVTFHEVNTDVYVMEVVVGWFQGIVFYDNQGPECYEVLDDEERSSWEIKRVDFSTWIERVRFNPRGK